MPATDGRPVVPDMPHDARADLPLFPLKTVLFPGGLLGLKVFEARYLDMVSGCMRSGTTFGVVALRSGAEVRGQAQEESLEKVGVLAELIEVDSAQPGILLLRCRGTRRFELGSARQQDDGLWVGSVTLLADETPLPPTPELADTVQGLRNAIGALKAQDAEPFLPPYDFDSAGWVANRWCEILPIPLPAKQRLMELSDPLLRLKVVDEFLRSQGVVA